MLNIYYTIKITKGSNFQNIGSPTTHLIEYIDFSDGMDIQIILNHVNMSGLAYLCVKHSIVPLMEKILYKQREIKEYVH